MDEVTAMQLAYPPYKPEAKRSEAVDAGNEHSRPVQLRVEWWDRVPHVEFIQYTQKHLLFPSFQ